MEEWCESYFGVGRCKSSITSQIMNFASAIGDNPNAVGKDSNIWNLAYMTVLLQQGDELK